MGEINKSQTSSNNSVLLKIALFSPIFCIFWKLWRMWQLHLKKNILLNAKRNYASEMPWIFLKFEYFLKVFSNFKNKKSVQFVTKWKPIHKLTCASKLKHHLLHGFGVRTAIWINYIESSFKFKTKSLVRLLGFIFFYFSLNILLLVSLCCFLWPWQCLFFILLSWHPSALCAQPAAGVGILVP